MTCSWGECRTVVQEGLDGLAMNKFKESESLFSTALDQLEASSNPDPAIKAMYRMGLGCVALAEGFAASALDRLNEALPQLWKAEAEAAQANTWIGVQLVRGVSLLFGGMIQILQKENVKGGLNLTKAWSIIKPAAEEGLVYQGENADMVRSMSLFLLGGMNLLVSILPPAIVSVAGFAGFDGKRSRALNRLRQCWKEQGLFSAFAALVILNFHILARPLIFEKQTPVETALCEQLLSWGEQKFPGSLLFELFRGLHLLTIHKHEEAIQVFGPGCHASEVATLKMIFLYKRGFAKLITLDFEAAAEDFAAGANSQIQSGRFSYVPACKCIEALCLLLIGKSEISRVSDCWEEVERQRGKHIELMMPSDLWSLRKAEHYGRKQISDCKSCVRKMAAIDLFYGPVLFLASMADKIAPKTRKLVKALLVGDCECDLPINYQCQREVFLAELSRQDRKRSAALDHLESVLEIANAAEDAERNTGWFGSSSTPGKNSLCLASEAVVPIALLWQAAIFVEAKEAEAALEGLKELDDGLARDAGILGIGLNAIGIAADTGTEFDVFLKFRRSGLKRLADQIGNEEEDDDLDLVDFESPSDNK